MATNKLTECINSNVAETALSTEARFEAALASTFPEIVPLPIVLSASRIAGDRR